MINMLHKYAFVFTLIFSVFVLWSSVASAIDVNVGATKGRCDIVKINAEYTKSCFSCSTVSTIISVFLEAGAAAYPIMRQAGNEILGILSALWIAMFLLKNLSQFNAIELPDFIQQLGLFFFKIIVAFIFLNGGVTVILSYTLEPIISFGTDFGIGILSLTADIPTESSSAADYINLLNSLNGTEVLHA